MDARLCRPLLVIAAWASVAATYPTPNFVVTAPTEEIAKTVALAAEKYREELAVEWLGKPLPRWSSPCPVSVKVGQIGAGGATTFTFHPSAKGPSEVLGWDMQIQGSLERILDSVLPHEVSHTIFACYFRRPLPRWADEGAATLVEHESERHRQVLTAKQVLGTRRRIPLRQLLAIKEYPRDMQDILTLYAEGYTLAELLVQKGGKTRYLKFLNDAHANGWEAAITANYNYRNIEELEKVWTQFIESGCPEPKLPKGQLLADREPKGNSLAGQYVIRGQSPPVDPFIATTAARAETPRALSGEEGAAPRRRTLPAKNPARPASRAAESPLVGTDPYGPESIPLEDGWEAAPDEEFETRAANPSRNQRDSRSSGVALGDEAVDTADAGTAEAWGEWQDVPGRTLSPKFSGSEAPRSIPSAARQRLRSSGVPSNRTGDRSRRAATQWSEFPQDPRPSPLALSGRP